MESFEDYFPYKRKRKNQWEFLKFIYDNIYLGKNVVTEAATGFGKTIGALASVLPIAQELEKKIVYCCRTHKQMDRVVEELKVMAKKTQVSGVSLRGRREMCLHNMVLNHTGDTASAMHVCQLLRQIKKCDYYERFKKEQDRILELEIGMSKRPTFSQEILEICRGERICPYEFIKELIRDVDVVACSYMYMFHPQIRENFLEALGCSLDDIILILDEAHNLPDLAIDLGSDSLTLSSIRIAVDEALEYEEDEIAKFLELLQKIVLEIAEKYNVEDEVLLEYQELVMRFFTKNVRFLTVVAQEVTELNLKEFLNYAKKVGEEIQKDRLRLGKPPRSYLHHAASFLLNWIACRGRKDYCYIIKKYQTRGGNESFKLEIVDLDPRNITTQCLDSVFASVSMSGTLSPLRAFSEIVGLKNYNLKVFPSPFKKSNILVLAQKGVTTKGDKRSLDMYRKICQKVCEVIEATPKNVGVFCASYEVLEGLLSAGLKLISSKPFFVERREYTSRENDEIVRGFKENARKNGAVLLGVLGGRNAEGEDYPGDEMNTVVLVGVPYAKPTARIKAQVDYFSNVFPSKGKYYGYYLPAHRKLNQGAGRAHRLLSDRAAIVFLDYRVINSFVRKDISPWIRREMRILEDREKLVYKIVKIFFELM